MSKRGFSLIELLAVITILLIIITIVFINVTVHINKSADVSYDILLKSIVQSTELYVVDHSGDFPDLNIPGSIIEITLNDLVEDGYLKANLIDERTEKQVPLNTKIFIKVKDKNKIDVTLDY